MLQDDADQLKDEAALGGGTAREEQDREEDLIQQALNLFALKQHRLLFEAGTDSKAVVAWNEDTILVSFRGTASKKAAKLDLAVRNLPLFCSFQAQACI